MYRSDNYSQSAVSLRLAGVILFAPSGPLSWETYDMEFDISSLSSGTMEIRGGSHNTYGRYGGVRVYTVYFEE